MVFLPYQHVLRSQSGAVGWDRDAGAAAQFTNLITFSTWKRRLSFGAPDITLRNHRWLGACGIAMGVPAPSTR
ncbi:hypothetical protein CEP88_18975 [Roseobacter denitrificans]|uniref:Uncharacterized protein n=1 Tax=Roseobacter denitrificans (strain ATCC 33942 / OCh 114) TaxID=375451 RepID=Q168Y5_ROSDO|nr:hypothetical protein RD1_1843 [Roseobacter denitrificans OCh 114]AVL54465.1 hypothetical protein CEP88_18975 [Roseobacter denitrificans]